MPILRALLGHPKAGARREEFISSVLKDVKDVGFKSITHDSLFRGHVMGGKVHAGRQFDDTALGVREVIEATKIIVRSTQ
jgi:hypothetical protein